MKRGIILTLLAFAVFAQTSEYRTSFFNKRTNQKESGLSGYAWLVPQVNSYPAGAITLYAVPGYDDYYYCIVQDGEYKIYIDLDKSGPSVPVLYRQNVWIGEKRITTMANQFFQAITDETEKLELSKYSDLEKSSAPDFAKKFSENFEKVDSAVKYFDPRFFEVSGDEVTLNTTLYDSTLIPVADTVINNTSLVPTSAAVFRADNRIRADINNLLNLYALKTGATFSGTVYVPTINAFSSILLNGTNINTTGTLSAFAYKAQNNNFATHQSIAGNIILVNNILNGRSILASTDTSQVRIGGGSLISTANGAYIILGGVSNSAYPSQVRIQAGTGGSIQINGTTAINGNVSTRNLEPTANDTYYIGKNDDDSPLAFKGIILRDQAGTGKYYRIEVYNNTLRIVDLTD